MRATTLFPTQPVDPGYGDPDAPEGSAEWAKRWRLGFQSATQELEFCPDRAKRYLDAGLQHRAWTLVTDEYGEPFHTFSGFCETPKPYGLGMPYDQFHGFMVARFGKQAVELLTVPVEREPVAGPGRGHKTSSDDRTVFTGHDRTAKLRAILRAPEIIQGLYREGLVSQTTAAMMGPKKPTEEQATRVVQARQAVEQIRRPDVTRIPERRAYRRQVDQAIREVMGKKLPSPLESIQRMVRKLSQRERQSLSEWLEAGMP